MTENTLEKLAQLLEQDQFELIFSESGAGRGQDIRLVYLMNDAVELSGLPGCPDDRRISCGV